jgi:hypothetical protein
MVEQVSGRVFDKRNFPDILPVNVNVQTEKNAQAGLSEDCAWTADPK